LEWSETPVFGPKTGFFDLNLFPNFFCKIFANLKKLGFSKNIPNLGNQTIPKLAKMENLEISIFRRALFWTSANYFFFPEKVIYLLLFILENVRSPLKVVVDKTCL